MRHILDDVRFVHGGVFTSDEPWIHPDICNQTTELIIMIKGVANIQEDGIRYELAEKEFLVLDAGKKHCGTEYSNETVSFYWFHFDGELPKNFLKKTGKFPERDRIDLLCRQLLHYANTPTCEPCASDYSLRLLLLEMEQQSRENVGGTIKFSVICEWIRIHSDRVLLSGDVAEQFGYHEDYLARLFRKYLKCSLKQYINQCRMSYLKTLLLSTDFSLKEIAYKAGFREYKYFLKFFTFHEGMTPTAFRNGYINIHENKH